MEVEKFTVHCKDVAKLASKNKGHYVNLVFPQRRYGRPVIREPEIRDIFGRYLTLKDTLYGIEVPSTSKGKYCFSGKANTRSASTDLSIFESLSAAETNDPIVNIEFKEGQPTLSQIEKDWRKLLREPVHGTCFYHVLQNSNRRTFPDLIDKYFKAFSQAKQNIEGEVKEKWFLFFCVTIQKHEYYSL